MKISLLNQNYNKPQFKGEIIEGCFVKRALTHFNKAELEEFNLLKDKMSKVKDGMVYSLCIGTECDYNLIDKFNYYFNPDIYYRYIQLCSKKDNKYFNFYKKEIYRIDTGRKLDISEFDSDNKAFVRAILEPLKKIYR